MRSEIVSIGTEILMGQITDTNASWIAQQLPALGIDIYWVSGVGDNRERLMEVLRRAFSRSDLVICSGGLGPTEDDVTRESIAGMLGEEMRVAPELESHLRSIFERRGGRMPERNIKQATLIPSAKAIPNPNGTAPGWWVERDGHVLAAMPGVPHEMRWMWENEVVPRLREKLGNQIIFSRILKVIGLGESAAEERIHHLIRGTNPTVGTYAQEDGIHLRLTAKAESLERARELVNRLDGEMRDVLGIHIYGVDDQTLEGVVGEKLLEHGLTLATMESCTGGRLSNAITDTPGSSAYYRGGIIAYANDAKTAFGVPAETLQKHGAVSVETAIAMAAAVRQQLGAAVGLAVTGVAGP
ncbi:MAG: competence/damage-inducible protein A, partial [Chloroflexota bacterium]|nr:competence/damage-inducible protein A [Chloroflexota bacterium]